MNDYHNFHGYSVRKKKSLICATDLSKEHNQQTGEKRSVYEFLRTQATQNFIDMLVKEKSCLVTDVIITKRGKHGGTWFCRELALLFIRWMQKIRVDKFTRDELVFGDLLKKVFSGVLDVQRQVSIGIYKIDFCIHRLNLCIEFDERHHQNSAQKHNDIKRQKYIEENTGYTFLRVTKGDELDVLNKILRLYSQSVITVPR